ncbi:MAG: glutamyl-tRNA reductase [Thermodesulfobacteriota bacterium]
MNLRDGKAATGNNMPMAQKAEALPEIFLIGINHVSAPVEIRECLAFSTEQSAAALEELKKSTAIKEILIISTCNRVEFLFTSHCPEEAVQTVISRLSETKALPSHRFEPAMYIHSGNAAVRHVFRVAASLDSMIVGEPQILGQIKEAYRLAVNNKATGVVLNRLLHKAFSTAKRVRSETGIGDRAISISYAAVELAKKIFGSLEGKTVLLVGAGEMAELAVEHLHRNRASGNLYVANRTFDVGVDLAHRFSGEAVRFEEIGATLTRSDIIISSTGSPGYVISHGLVRPIMRKRRNRPLFFIDIAVPRDIDPEINRLENAYVYDIDDLQGVIEENIHSRQNESVKAERIIDEGVIRFRNWHDSLDVVPTIKQIRSKLTTIAEAELAKTLPSMGHLSAEDVEALNKMVESIVNKSLHDPILFLKNPGSHRDKSLYIDVFRKIFNLEDD